MNILTNISRRAVLLGALVGLTSFTTLSQPIDTLFSQANDLYRAGAYEQAAAAYEAILAQGVVSGELQFNLGNCYYRRGQVGRAILAFERAARLMPSDDDVRHNLHLTRLRAVDRIDPVPEFFLVSWLRIASEYIPVFRARVIFFAFWALLFASLAVLYLGRSVVVITWSRLAFFVSVPFALLSGVLFFSQSVALQEENAGIIVTPTVTAKSSPDASGTDAFVIHEGLKVEMATTVDGWTRVTLADGKVGWVREKDVEKI